MLRGPSLGEVNQSGSGGGCVEYVNWGTDIALASDITRTLQHELDLVTGATVSKMSPDLTQK